MLPVSCHYLHYYYCCCCTANVSQEGGGGDPTSVGLLAPTGRPARVDCDGEGGRRGAPGPGIDLLHLIPRPAAVPRNTANLAAGESPPVLWGALHCLHSTIGRQSAGRL